MPNWHSGKAGANILKLSIAEKFCHDAEKRELGTKLAYAGIELSVGSRGDAYDNALAESVIGLFKTEVIRRQGPCRSLETVEFATLAWVDWFNTRRLLEPIGYVPPAEYEAQYYQQTAVA